MTLFIDDLRDSLGPTPILDQGPLWMSWSPDSQYLLVHRGGNHFLVNTLEGMRVDELDIDAFGYRVPAWKPPGAIVTLASGGGPGDYMELHRKIATSLLQRGIANLRPMELHIEIASREW